MALKIIWSKRAEQGYDRIVRYLIENWSEKEVKMFVQETSKFLDLLIENPRILQKSQTRKNLFRGPMNRLTMITYRIYPRKKVIEIVNIRSTRQKPIDD
jgi:plasmid stabilization system protein ParE